MQKLYFRNLYGDKLATGVMTGEEYQNLYNKYVANEFEEMKDLKKYMKSF